MNKDDVDKNMSLQFDQKMTQLTYLFLFSTQLYFVILVYNL